MADMTLSWPRLRWPRWAWRQAGPWVRKMSATSRAACPTAAAYAGWQHLQRADHLAQDLGGHVRVDRRGLELLVPEQDLDHADVDLLLQQVGGEAVAQRVHRHALVDLRGLGSGMDGAVELARASAGPSD